MLAAPIFFGQKTPGHCRGCYVRVYANSGDSRSSLQSASQKKVADFMTSPQDFLTFGPRLAVGSIATLPKRFTTLQDDIATLGGILQSPADDQEKQRQLVEEVELRVVETLEAGSQIEGDLLDLVKDQLPEPVTSALEGITGRREGAVGGVEAATGSLPSTAADSARATTSAPDMKVNLAVSELQRLSDTVSELTAALKEADSNDDPSRARMLKDNVGELRDRLDSELAELQPGVTSSDINGVPVATAIEEAELLLQDTTSWLITQ